MLVEHKVSEIWHEIRWSIYRSGEIQGEPNWYPQSETEIERAAIKLNPIIRKIL